MVNAWFISRRDSDGSRRLAVVHLHFCGAERHHIDENVRVQGEYTLPSYWIGKEVTEEH